jgi:hypothetical protein
MLAHPTCAPWPVTLTSCLARDPPSPPLALVFSAGSTCYRGCGGRRLAKQERSGCAGWECTVHLAPEEYVTLTRPVPVADPAPVREAAASVLVFTPTVSGPRHPVSCTERVLVSEQWDRCFPCMSHHL